MVILDDVVRAEIDGTTFYRNAWNYQSTFSKIVYGDLTYVIGVRGENTAGFASKRSLVYVDGQLIAATGVNATTNELAATWKMTSTAPTVPNWWTDSNFDDSTWTNVDQFIPSCNQSQWLALATASFGSHRVQPFAVWYPDCTSTSNPANVYFRLKFSTRSCADGRIMPIGGCYICPDGSTAAFYSSCPKCADGAIANATRSNCSRY